MSTQTAAPRFWIIDLTRAIAILMMVYYHLMWDLNYFGVIAINMLSGPWHNFAYGIASTFLFVMGVSLTISYRRAVEKSGTTHQFFKFFQRGLRVFGWGMLITAVTYFFIGEGFVIFGILHLLGTSIVIAYPFLTRKWLSLLAGIGFIVVGIAVEGVAIPQPWFLWAGVMQYGRYMVDYYPVFPWTGVVLLGVFAGQVLFPGGKPIFTLPDISRWPVIRELLFSSRHSLRIYLLHQPALMAILFVLGIATLP